MKKLLLWSLVLLAPHAATYAADQAVQFLEQAQQFLATQETEWAEHGYTLRCEIWRGKLIRGASVSSQQEDAPQDTLKQFYTSFINGRDGTEHAVSTEWVKLPNQITGMLEEKGIYDSGYARVCTWKITITPIRPWWKRMISQENRKSLIAASWAAGIMTACFLLPKGYAFFVPKLLQEK